MSRSKRGRDFTGSPEMLDGRVKTLHPQDSRRHPGAALRRDPSPRRCAEHGIEPIDLVVVNFYPFERTVERAGVSLDDAIENIDIGGPALVRAAAKNYARRGGGGRPGRLCGSDRGTRKRSGGASSARDPMAAGAQGLCAGDRVRLRDLELPRRDRGRASAEPLGETFSLSLAARAAPALRRESASAGALYGDFLEIAEQLHGHELSYNNVVDISSAINLMLDFADYSDAVVAILKHNTPCGVGVGETLQERVGQGVRDRSRLALRRDHHRQSPVGPGSSPRPSTSYSPRC